MAEQSVQEWAEQIEMRRRARGESAAYVVWAITEDKAESAVHTSGARVAYNGKRFEITYVDGRTQEIEYWHPDRISEAIMVRVGRDGWTMTSTAA